MRSRDTERLALAAFIAEAVLAGGNAVSIRYSNRELAPLWGHPVTMNAVGMATGAALLVIGTLIAGEPLVLPQRAATWLAISYLVVIGSILVFVLYVVVVRLWGASRAAYGFVLTPVVTVLISR